MTRSMSMKEKYLQRKRRQRKFLLQKAIGSMGLVLCAALLKIDASEAGTAVLILGPLFAWMALSRRVLIL